MPFCSIFSSTYHYLKEVAVDNSWVWSFVVLIKSSSKSGRPTWKYIKLSLKCRSVAPDYAADLSVSILIHGWNAKEREIGSSTMYINPNFVNFKEKNLKIRNRLLNKTDYSHLMHMFCIFLYYVLCLWSIFDGEMKIILLLQIIENLHKENFFLLLF